MTHQVSLFGSRERWLVRSKSHGAQRSEEAFHSVTDTQLFPTPLPKVCIQQIKLGIVSQRGSDDRAAQ